MNKKLKAHGIICRVKNCAIDEVPEDAQILVPTVILHNAYKNSSRMSAAIACRDS